MAHNYLAMGSQVKSLGSFRHKHRHYRLALSPTFAVIWKTLGSLVHFLDTLLYFGHTLVHIVRPLSKSCSSRYTLFLCVA